MFYEYPKKGVIDVSGFLIINGLWGFSKPPGQTIGYRWYPKFKVSIGKTIVSAKSTQNEVLPSIIIKIINGDLCFKH